MRLKSPHLLLGPASSSGVVDGERSLVQGDYLYYHYGQDGFDDKGWGCSYRSLQTLCSWFVQQGFSSTDVPSHREIQTTLVKVGDKEGNFVGSTNWIGSFELSLILDQLYGVRKLVVDSWLFCCPLCSGTENFFSVFLFLVFFVFFCV